MTSVKALVDSTIEKNPIVVFSKSWCPYCKKAKDLLAKEFKDTPAIVLELDERDDGSEIQSYLQTKTQQRTVPNVFIKQEHIGGCDDTFAAFNSGKLAGLLKALPNASL